MTPVERDELNAAVARLDGWGPRETFTCWRGVPDYLGDPRLWAPILERIVNAWWVIRPIEDVGFFIFREDREDEYEGNTLPEAVLRLFVALEGRV